MNKFDREIKKLSSKFEVPESYHKKVDEMLEKIQEDNVAVPKKKLSVKAAVIIIAFCLSITGVFFLFGTEVAEASFLETFKQTIMDFFGMSKSESQELGVESDKQEAVSKKDLMMELQEIVMDTQNIYAVVKITAPPDVEFKKDMTFDYFGFCEGTNYNASNVVAGARSCTLFEVLENKKNEATYVVSIVTDKQIEEGKDVTVFFQNLIAGPYEDEPEILVEGMWSLSFSAIYTNTKEITIKGTDDMQYSFAGTTADIKKIKLLPLGLTLVSDVSKVPVDILNTTDTRFVIRFKMIDGDEIIVESPNVEDKALVAGGEIAQYEKKGRTYQKYVGQFSKAIDINKVLGIYIADYYIPLKDYK